MLADGRDLYKGTRRTDVPVSDGGQSRENRRFPSEQEPRRERGEGLSAQAMKGQRTPMKNHPGRLRRLTSGGGGVERKWRVAEARASTNQQMPEQPIEQDHWRVQQRLPPDAGAEEFPDGRAGD